MLGQFMRQRTELPPQSIASSKVLDAVKEHWRRSASVTDVTLAKKKPIWKEWWIGASSIHKICPRMFALMAAVGSDGIKAEEFNAETLWLFDQGHAYHDLMQQKILASLPDGILLGRWKRYEDGDRGQLVEEITNFKNDVPDGVSLERGWGPRPEGDGWRYDEPKLRVPQHRLVVKIDAILDWPDEDGLEVVEIKTEKSSEKDVLNPRLGGRPRSQHVEQAHIGMFATGIRRARIVYIFKGEKSLSTSVIEHVIEWDQALMDDILRRAETCVKVVGVMDDRRRILTLEVCEEAHPGEDAVEYEDLRPDLQDEVRVRLKKIADEVPRLIGCDMKSKGRPRYCGGRDLCFGVRKRKKK